MKIYLVGIGMGDFSTLTTKANEVIKNADIIIGAKRMTEKFENGKDVFNSYKPEEIFEYLQNNKHFKNVAILLSGDVGFYSGAKKLLSVFNGFNIELVPGISSVVYFCSKLQISWEDVKLLSLHGKMSNIVQYVKRFKKVFLLLSGNENIKEICQKFLYYGFENLILHIGERLSYDDERILTVKVKDLKTFDFDNLSVMIIENNEAVQMPFYRINDEDFIRGKVPMTKSEIRDLSILKLGLSNDSILYDIGAGTGSIAIESALNILDGQVFAIEKDENAIALIEENKRKFAADNLTIIKGVAPKVLKGLTIPTHIFIGGSSGNMSKIIDFAIKQNENVKIVINAIALNTISEITQIIKKNGFLFDIACINVSKNKTVGSYELMMAQNPVYIIKIIKNK